MELVDFIFLITEKSSLYRCGDYRCRHAYSDNNSDKEYYIDEKKNNSQTFTIATKKYIAFVKNVIK